MNHELALNGTLPRHVEGAGKFLYVVRTKEGYRKIGITKRPDARLSTLQTSSPYPIIREALIQVVEGDHRQIESAAHNILGYRRVSGEWFKASKTDAQIGVKMAAEQCGAVVVFCDPRKLPKEPKPRKPRRRWGKKYQTSETGAPGVETIRKPVVDAVLEAERQNLKQVPEFRPVLFRKGTKTRKVEYMIPMSITMAEASDATGASVTLLRSHMKKGILPYFEIGKSVRFRTSCVAGWLSYVHGH